MNSLHLIMPLHPEAQILNDLIDQEHPALGKALSSFGRRVYAPKGIPFQAQQAAGCKVNATIGQITDGKGQPLPLDRLAGLMKDLPQKDVFLYSPIQGRERCRTLWKNKLIAEDIRFSTLSLPGVSLGICHALAMATDLFFERGDTLVVPDLYWDNYDQIFEVRHEARMVHYPFYDGTTFNIKGLKQVLDEVSGKVHVLLNFPNNPTGFSPTLNEIKQIADLLVSAAEKRIVVVYCDDAYHGLVFEPNATTQSLFFELIDRHPNLIALKADGVTKELSFFGGRVGFLSLGFSGPVGQYLNEKICGLVRGSVGSPVGISQFLSEEELLDPQHESSFQNLKSILEKRYRVLQAGLSQGSPFWTPLPFNSGCFCLLQLNPGLQAEKVREQLIKDESVGVVSHLDRYLRIAFCSMTEKDISILLQALHRTCEKMEIGRF
ncbi:MAG: aminotransferase class I/II-fold pyridoxal phosphate-dependent enzyme [Holophagaceae bacterium]